MNFWEKSESFEKLFSMRLRADLKHNAYMEKIFIHQKWNSEYMNHFCMIYLAYDDTRSVL